MNDDVEKEKKKFEDEKNCKTKRFLRLLLLFMLKV